MKTMLQVGLHSVDLMIAVIQTFISGHYVSENERRKFKVRTDRQLRLRELLQYHSSDSRLIVM